MARGVTGFRFSELFWRTLEPHRGLDYYAPMRAKLLGFMRRKTQDTGPVSARDGTFGNHRTLKGIWHFAIQRNPDVVLFYTLEGGTLNLAMFGSHHDYPSDGKNLGKADRTSVRVWNATRGDDLQHPDWPGAPRWRQPEDILGNTELPEFGPRAMDALLGEIAEEQETGARYRALHGIPVEETSDAELDRYLAALQSARDLILDIRGRRAGASYWLLVEPPDARPAAPSR